VLPITAADLGKPLSEYVRVQPAAIMLFPKDPKRRRIKAEFAAGSNMVRIVRNVQSPELGFRTGRGALACNRSPENAKIIGLQTLLVQYGIGVMDPASQHDVWNGTHFYPGLLRAG
jgi:hypothetical protein